MENHYNCIYMYINKINGKRYVGQAVNFNKRHYEHQYAMTHENHDEYDRPIQRAFRRYGLDNFEVEILKENLNTQCLLNFYECYYIKKFDLLCKNGKGYNLSEGGYNGNPMAGKTEEEIKQWKQKQSEAHKWQKGENNSMWGKKHSELTKQKISEAKKGKYTGENNPMYGKHLSEEHKQKISETLKGKRCGENHPMYGKHHTEETKKKLREANSIKIAQYNKKTNELIKIWHGAIEIERKLGIDNGSIIKCCKGKRKTAGGFIWRYAE